MKAGLLLLPILSAGAYANVKTELESRYKLWDAAYLKHDVKTLASLLHPRFKLVPSAGPTQSRKSYVQRLWRSNRPAVYLTTLEKTERSGSRVFAYTNEISMWRGQEPGKHYYRDTWTKVRGHWKLVESRTLNRH